MIPDVIPLNYDGPNVIAEYNEYDEFQRYYVHGPTYVDERLLVHDAVTGKEYYYGPRELYTVAALFNEDAQPTEAYHYDAYGRVDRVERIWVLGDLDRDGDVDGSDFAIFSQCQNGPGNPPNPACPAGTHPDLDGDGDVDNQDFIILSQNFTGAASPADGTNYGEPAADNTTELGNVYYFTGRRLDRRTIYGADRQFYHYRARAYDPEHGRFLQRDPHEYVDGMNLYEFMISNPGLHLDPTGLACCASVWIKNAYGIPGLATIGGGHVGIELDRDGRTTIIELAGFRSPLHPESDRIGSGPLGPTMYIYYALLANSIGLSSREDLQKLNSLAVRFFGQPGPGTIDLVDNMGQRTIGGGPRNFYGLYLSDQVPPRGSRQIYLDLPAGRECQTLDAIEWAALDIGWESLNEAKMPITIKTVKKDVEFKLLGRRVKIDQLDIDFTAELWVGYGYDLVSRNSNSFAGSVLRKAGVGVPSDVSQQLGFENDFTDWRQWDRTFQREFQAAVNKQLGI